ncbi:LRRC45 [Cervus elaphus hippelaphus]|uniref:LRRC45 n=1 Tax=Cervus elaphus hippelaphus TaxID=46360 RepID=A0A212D7Z1_CEREH|nr:LRRC45 [Cervus elaphus hippelaphus]
MEEFRRAYSRLCKESGTEPQETVLQQLHQLPQGRLDLATQSLTVDTCRALGKLLQKESLLTELILSDCMLSEEGATLLLQGLCVNTVVRFLDLKGNNLRAAGAEALAKLLRQNKSIQSLTLEWNNLGTWDEAFATFCGALAANGTLRQLDLRNNQINHKGAEELALALKSNASLQQLDLRWNHIGLLGGRALVNCLPSNRTLWKLELAGNNIPGDILRAVVPQETTSLFPTEQAMDHNQDRQTVFRESQARAQVLSKEVRHLREEKSKQFMDLMETIDRQREEMARSSKASAARVGQLQEALNERHSIINALKAKRDPDCARATVQAAIWGAALGPALRPSFLRSHLGQPLVGKNRVPKIHLPPPGWGSHEGKPRGPDCQPYPCLAPGQVEHMTRHLEDSERAMQERVQRLEAARLSLEEELSRVKAAALSERSQAEEELIKAKNQVRLEEQQHLAHLEEKLRLLAQARDEAQSACVQQKQTVADAQARASQLGLQVESLRRRLEELQQELSNKDQEKVAEVTRVRLELQEQNGRLQAELTAQEALKEKAAALERQLKGELSPRPLHPVAFLQGLPY